MHVLATAGHVDHGKSTLIERITGIDPDRLAEEKTRGLTIDLGFAWMTLPSGREAGIVDVPGHTRFVSNMLAGVGAVDATIFVVAANEGWKPQSEEHLAIIDLLGVRGGVLVLTKSDLVTAAELSAVSDAVGTRLEGTALEKSPIVPVSTTTGAGIDALIRALEDLLERTPPSPDLGRPRLHVDRSFSVKGAGTVVTGTLTGGRLRVDDEIAILPGRGAGRIRSIQTHKRLREEAEPGSRVALNIAGVDRAAVRRGQAVVHPGQWRTTRFVDVCMRRVRGIDQPLGPRGAYKLHLGSAEVDARLRPLEDVETTDGTERFARLALSDDVVADAFDRFVLRDAGRSLTVAGGVVLDAHPQRQRLGRDDVPERVKQLAGRRDRGRDGLVAALLEERGAVRFDDLGWLAGAAPTDGPVRGYATSAAWLANIAETLTGLLEHFHAANPLERGMPREDLKAAAQVTDARLFAALLDALSDRMVAEGTLVRLSTHRVTLPPELEADRSRLLEELDAAGMAPPAFGDLAARHGTALVGALVGAGDIVKVSAGVAFTRARYEDAKRAIATAIAAEGPLTAARIRDVLGTTRKYLIPMLEHLDSIGFTKRTGDVRALGGGR